MSPPMVSVIVPMFNEEQFIRACLDSILAQDYPLSCMEILVVDGGSTDASRRIVESYVEVYPNVRLLDNPRRIQAAALNVGLRHASGDIIVRCDAHATYAPDYVRSAVEALVAGKAENVGGTQVAVGRGYLGNAIALALSTPFGVGDARFRYATQEELVDTVYLGAWRASTLRELGGWNEEWAVNEDYELNYRLRARGGRILVTPTMRLRYYVRDSLRGLAKQYFRYGFWKVKTLRAHPASLRWRQAVPPLFALALIGSAGAAMYDRWLALIVPGVYVVGTIVGSVALGLRRGWKYVPVLPFVFATMHVCWGIGFLIGIFRFGPPKIGLGTTLRAVRAFSKPDSTHL